MDGENDESMKEPVVICTLEFFTTYQAENRRKAVARRDRKLVIQQAPADILDRQLLVGDGLLRKASRSRSARRVTRGSPGSIGKFLRRYTRGSLGL